MDIWKQIENLPNQLYLLGKKDSDAITNLDALLFNVYGERLDRHCSYCINKAYQKLINLTIQRFNEMKDQKYKFKDENALVYFQHAHYTKANLTDGIAVEMVKDNKANADLFDPAPEVKADKKVIEVPAETVIDKK